MNNIYFTSDLHLGHKNIIKYSNRPYKSIEEMDHDIVSKLFAKVKHGDTLYILGDIAFSINSLNLFVESKPKGINIHLILGGHDKNISTKYYKHFSSVSELKTIKINNQKIVLCHYFMGTWDCSHYGAWQLYGHTHYDISKRHVGKQMNICVDLHNYYPVSFDEVNNYMKSQPDNWNLIIK